MKSLTLARVTGQLICPEGKEDRVNLPVTCVRDKVSEGGEDRDTTIVEGGEDGVNLPVTCVRDKDSTSVRGRGR